MYPRIGGIDNIDGFSLYNPMLVLSVLVVLVIHLRLLHRDGYRPTQFLAYIIVLGLGGFLGAKLYSVVFHGGFRGVDVELAGGWRYPGSILGTIVAAFVGRRFLPAGLGVGNYLDAWAPAYAFGCSIGRLGCLLAGCCYGGVCHLPWAIAYPRGSIVWWAQFEGGEIASHATQSLPVHPFPLYLFAMEVGLGLGLLRLRPRRRYPGQVMLVFLAIHGVLKFLLEYFREPYHPLHQTVLLIALGAMAVMAFRRKDSDSVRMAR